MGCPYIINGDSVRGVHLTFAPLGMQLLLILSIRTVVPAAVLDVVLEDAPGKESWVRRPQRRSPRMIAKNGAA